MFRSNCERRLKNQRAPIHRYTDPSASLLKIHRYTDTPVPTPGPGSGSGQVAAYQRIGARLVQV